LGSLIVQALAAAGATVAIVFKESVQKAQALAEDLHSRGCSAIIVQADVSQEEGVARMIQQVMGTAGKIDILINDAAINYWVPFSDLDGLSPEIWEDLIRTNLTGPFLCSKAVAPVMRRQGAGRIVNVTSTAGLRPAGSSIPYAVSKAGLIHLTRCLAVALAPDILVNSVAPGAMEGTRLSEKLTPEHKEKTRQSSLLKKAANKSDVVDQILTFIRSDTTTGQTVVIDSGVFFH
jgi:3-oxoacyl-[acyl-carrier protein] reductase